MWSLSKRRKKIQNEIFNPSSGISIKVEGCKFLTRYEIKFWISFMIVTWLSGIPDDIKYRLTIARRLINVKFLFTHYLPKGLESELMKLFPMSKRLCPILVFNIIWPKLNSTSAGEIFSVRFSMRFEIGDTWNLLRARLQRFYINF